MSFNFRKQIKTKQVKGELREKQQRQGAKTLKDYQSSLDRRAMRQSELGRQMEDRVAGILVMKQKQGEIISFVKHLPNSPEDRAGKDFTVSMLVGEKIVTTSFAITISNKQTKLYVPLIRTPWNMADEKIWQAILKLCQEQANES